MPIPYALSGASIIALKSSAIQPKTEDELCGVKVGLQAGTAWVSSLKTHSDEYCLKNGKPAISIQEFPTAPEASQALLSKNINAQLEIAPAAQIIVEKSRDRLPLAQTAWSIRCRWEFTSPKATPSWPRPLNQR